jgi:hypothetical protein
VEKWHTKGPYLIGEIGMIAYHHHDRHIQFTTTVAPQSMAQRSRSRPMSLTGNPAARQWILFLHSPPP